MSWMMTAEEASEQEQKWRRRKVPRYWMPRDSENLLVFIDDVPRVYYEHNPPMGTGRKRHRNHLTCPNEIDSLCCELIGRGRGDRYKIFGYTVVDCDSWTDSRGKKHEFEIKLFPAKRQTYKQLDKMRKREGGIAGKMLLAERNEIQHSPNVGSKFTIRRKVQAPTKLFQKAMWKGTLLSDLWSEAEADEDALEDLQKIFQVEFNEDGSLVREVPRLNYLSLLEPMSQEEMAVFLSEFRHASPKASDQVINSNGPTTIKEDDIAF